jgi:hypothetical protein
MTTRREDLSKTCSLEALLDKTGSCTETRTTGTNNDRIVRMVVYFVSGELSLGDVTRLCHHRGSHAAVSLTGEISRYFAQHGLIYSSEFTSGLLLEKLIPWMKCVEKEN